MTDKIELVSESSEGEVAAKRLNWPIKQVTENILRIVAGAGKSDQVIDQMRAVIEAHEKLIKLTGNTIAADIAFEDALRSLDWRASDPNRSHPDGSTDVRRAESAVVQAACRVAAAQISAQSSQESKSQDQLMTAINNYNKAWDMHRRKTKRLWRGKA